MRVRVPLPPPLFEESIMTPREVRARKRKLEARLAEAETSVRKAQEIVYEAEAAIRQFREECPHVNTTKYQGFLVGQQYVGCDDCGATVRRWAYGKPAFEGPADVQY